MLSCHFLIRFRSQRFLTCFYINIINALHYLYASATLPTNRELTHHYFTVTVVSIQIGVSRDIKKCRLVSFFIKIKPSIVALKRL
jgi:hypothetical protein